jgi:hypothetical protein
MFGKLFEQLTKCQELLTTNQSLSSLSEDEAEHLFAEFLRSGRTKNPGYDSLMADAKAHHADAWALSLQEHELWKVQKELEADLAFETDPAEKRKMRREVAAIKLQRAELNATITRVFIQKQQAYTTWGEQLNRTIFGWW